METKAPLPNREVTALEELINRLEVAYQRGDKKYKPAFDHWLKEARNLLPKERRIIEDAYDEGYGKGSMRSKTSSAAYFYQKFKK